MERTFDEAQIDTARDLGYGEDVDAMNRDHDPLHVALCGWLGVPCVALPGGSAAAVGSDVAMIEETAVMAVQKLMRAHGAKVPV